MGDLSKLGGKGAFVKEIDRALLDDSADLAVHCLKDIPGDIPVPEQDFLGPWFGEFGGDVDPDFTHRFDSGGVDFIAGFGAAGPRDGFVSGEVGEEPECHLRAPRIVGAQKQHGRLAGGALPSTFARALRRWRAKRSASSGRRLTTVARPANWS
jgi:hypothetical protein